MPGEVCCSECDCVKGKIRAGQWSCFVAEFLFVCVGV